MPFQVLDAENPEGLASWLALWRRFPDREVFAHPEYVRLYAGPSARPLCAAYRSESLFVLYPFLLRDLSCEPFWSPSVGAACDIATPYGYGGPFACGDRYSPEAGRFWEEFDGWCARNHVVSEFVRFSLFPERLLPYPGRSWRVAEHVVRPILVEESQLWIEYGTKVRRSVSRAKESGVYVEIEDAGSVGARLDEFLALYAETMRRRGAKASYYFPRDFFGQMASKLAGSALYFFALRDGELLSAELVLVSARSVYSFLVGTRADAFASRPNHLLKHEIARWAKAQGKSNFVLGGGYHPNDGIFDFKLSFAPHGRTDYLQGGRVHDRERCGMLVEGRRTLEAALGIAWEPQEAFFPQYRG